MWINLMHCDDDDYRSNKRRKKCCCSNTPSDPFFTVEPDLCLTTNPETYRSVENDQPDGVIDPTDQASEIRLVIPDFADSPEQLNSGMTFTSQNISPDAQSIIWNVRFFNPDGEPLEPPGEFNVLEGEAITIGIPEFDKLLDLNTNSMDTGPGQYFTMRVDMQVLQPENSFAQVWSNKFIVTEEGIPTTVDTLDINDTIEQRRLGNKTKFSLTLEDANENQVEWSEGDPLTWLGDDNVDVTWEIYEIFNDIQSADDPAVFVPDFENAVKTSEGSTPARATTENNIDELNPQTKYILVVFTSDLPTSAQDCEQKSYVLYDIQNIVPRLYTQQGLWGPPKRVPNFGETVETATGQLIVHETTRSTPIDLSDPSRDEVEYAFEGYFPSPPSPIEVNWSAWGTKPDCPIQVQDVTDAAFTFETVLFNCIPWDVPGRALPVLRDGPGPVQLFNYERRVWLRPEVGSPRFDDVPQTEGLPKDLCSWNWVCPEQGIYDYTISATYFNTVGDVVGEVYMRYRHRYQEVSVRTAQRDLGDYENYTARTLVSNIPNLTLTDETVNETRVVQVDPTSPEVTIPFEYDPFPGAEFFNPIAPDGYEWIITNDTATLVITNGYQSPGTGRTDPVQATIQRRFLDGSMNNVDEFTIQTLTVSVEYENANGPEILETEQLVTVSGTPNAPTEIKFEPTEADAQTECRQVTEITNAQLTANGFASYRINLPEWLTFVSIDQTNPPTSGLFRFDGGQTESPVNLRLNWNPELVPNGTEWTHELTYEDSRVPNPEPTTVFFCIRLQANITEDSLPVAPLQVSAPSLGSNTYTHIVSQNRPEPETKFFVRNGTDAATVIVPYYWPATDPIGTVATVQITGSFNGPGGSTTATIDGTNRTITGNETTLEFEVTKLTDNIKEEYVVDINTSDGNIPVVVETYTTSLPQNTTYQTYTPGEVFSKFVNDGEPGAGEPVYSNIQMYLDTFEQNANNTFTTGSAAFGDAPDMVEWELPLGDTWSQWVTEQRANGTPEAEITAALPQVTISCNGGFLIYTSSDGGSTIDTQQFVGTGTYSNGAEMINFSYQPHEITPENTWKFYTTRRTISGRYNFIQIQWIA